MVDLSPSFTSSSPMPKNQLAEVLYESVALSLYCAAVEWFFYGMNVVLFCFCIKTLRNCRLPHRRGLSVAVAVIFSFCSLHCVLSLVNDAQWMAHIFNPLDKALLIRWDKVNIVMDVLYQTNNLIADGIFIYRCYGIWNFSKRIIILPITLLISTALLGYAGIIVCAFEGLAGFLFATWLFPLAVIFSVLTNILLMGLAAGRIWWICRGARAIMGPAVVKRYRTVVAMILESGALYVTLGILYLIFLAVPSSTLVIYSALAQIVGIAPTIIVVRVGLGNSVENVESFGQRQLGSVVDIGTTTNDVRETRRGLSYNVANLES